MGFLQLPYMTAASAWFEEVRSSVPRFLLISNAFLVPRNGHPTDRCLRYV